MLIIITLGRTAHARLAYANHLKLPRVIPSQDNSPACLKIRNYNSLNIIFTLPSYFPFQDTCHWICHGVRNRDIYKQIWSNSRFSYMKRVSVVSNELWARHFCFAGAIPFVKCLSERVWVGVGEFSENYHIKRTNARLHKQEFFQTSANFLPNCKDQWFVSSACSRDRMIISQLKKRHILLNKVCFFSSPALLTLLTWTLH